MTKKGRQKKKKGEKRNERKECKIENEVRENSNILNHRTKLIFQLF